LWINDFATTLQRQVRADNGGMIGKYQFMGKRVSLHRLDNVDLGKQTADCSICGPTQILVRRDPKHPHRAPSTMCINRYRESVRESQRRRRLQARLQNPNWKPKHKLSKVNPKKMRALCAICGPTDILKAINYHDIVSYRCATIMRKQARDYSRLHYKPKA
jgi:hypothetical protein